MSAGQERKGWENEAVIRLERTLNSKLWNFNPNKYQLVACQENSNYVRYFKLISGNQ